MNAVHYGVPQSRERIIFIGVRNDLSLTPTHPLGEHRLITVKDALLGCAPSEIMPVAGRNLQMIRNIRPGASSAQRRAAAIRVFGKTRNFSFLRLAWSKPSPTIAKTMRVSKSFGAGMVMPDEDRYVSISELKRLASFPDQFEMIGSFEDKWARIGNSVPQFLMWRIAEHLKTRILQSIERRYAVPAAA